MLLKLVIFHILRIVESVISLGEQVRKKIALGRTFASTWKLSANLTLTEIKFK